MRRTRVTVLAGGLAVVAVVVLFADVVRPNPGPAAPDRATVRPAVAAGPGSASATATGGDTAILCADTGRSLVRWRGTKLGGGKHEGVVRLNGGRLVVQDGAVVGGAFTIDMRTIAVTDIPPHEIEARRQLRSHLAHEEFFGVERFPTARFEITGVAGGEHGIYRVSGDLAVRDSVHNVSFDATAPVVGPESVWATADFSIDRYQWGVEFDGRTSSLRNAIVDDLIQLEITLVASAAGKCPG